MVLSFQNHPFLMRIVLYILMYSEARNGIYYKNELMKQLQLSNVLESSENETEVF